jgi:HAMP domain-containing protein
MRKQGIGFRMAVMAGGAVLMLVPALIAGWVYTGALQKEAEALVAAKLKGRGEIGADQIARRLYSLWQTVGRFARSANMTAPRDMQGDFTFLAGLDDRFSWLGVADVSGKVVASSRGILEGQDVSQRPWYRHGLLGPYAGDVHDSEQFGKALGREGELPRVVDFAAPIPGLSGSVGGVVGLQTNWNWISDQLASLTSPGTDVLLLARDRRVLFGPPELVGKQLGIGAALATGHGKAFVQPERWPDGMDYMTAVIPSVQYRDLPSFGWSVIVRQNMHAALGPTRELVRTFWGILGGGALVSLVLLYFGARWLATPLQRLVEFGERLSVGTADAAPHEETRYREVAQLSSLLVRLQSQLKVLPKRLSVAVAMPAGEPRDKARSSR